MARRVEIPSTKVHDFKMLSRLRRFEEQVRRVLG